MSSIQPARNWAISEFPPKIIRFVETCSSFDWIGVRKGATHSTLRTTAIQPRENSHRRVGKSTAEKSMAHECSLPSHRKCRGNCFQHALKNQALKHPVRSI